MSTIRISKKEQLAILCVYMCMHINIYMYVYIYISYILHLAMETSITHYCLGTTGLYCLLIIEHTVLCPL